MKGISVNGPNHLAVTLGLTRTEGRVVVPTWRVFAAVRKELCIGS